MPAALRKHLIDNFGLAADADEAAENALASAKIGSGDLSLQKYSELLAVKDAEPKDRVAELGNTIATQVSAALAPSQTAIADSLSEIAKSLKGRSAPPVAAPKVDDAGEDDGDVSDATLLKMEQRLAKKWGFDLKNPGTDGAALMGMGLDAASAEHPRVKSVVEGLRHTPTALVHTKERSRVMGLYGKAMTHMGREVNAPTELTQTKSAAWLAFQTIPELLTERELNLVKHSLHKDKFFMPGSTQARLLTEQERHEVFEGHMKFYQHRGGQKATTLIADNTSGGNYATPEYFDYDMIVAPTLANEDLPGYCNIIDMPRGNAAQNFVQGRPTVAATAAEGSATNLFTTDAFISNHDTSNFRAGGFMNLGINFMQDAHPGVLQECMNGYMNSHNLWLNEQICTGDGTTEPQGIMNASGTTNVTPTTPTTGPVVIADILEMMFGVSKAYRFAKGGLQNFVYVMTDTMYYRIRAMATGVTGDTRLVFGMDVNSYTLFNQPVLIVHDGMSNDYMIAANMKGYRLYRRQGPRFIREDRGATLVRANMILIGIDFRYGGQLDLGGYAAVATGFQT